MFSKHLNPANTNLDALTLALVYGYVPERAFEYEGHSETCTTKQSQYIMALSNTKSDLAADLRAVVNLNNHGSEKIELWECSKGQAMWVIQTFREERRGRRSDIILEALRGNATMTLP